MADYSGRKVKVILADDGGEYEGFVHSVDSNTHKLSLEKVVNCENGKKLLGLQHFYGNEVEDIEMLEEVARTTSKTKKASDKANSERGGPRLLHGKCEPKHLNHLKTLDPTSLLLKNKLDEDHEKTPGIDSSGSDSEGDGLSSDTHTVISQLGRVFYEAISFLKKHTVVSVSLEGVSIGRDGKLCWLQIGTSSHLFMFDVLKIGGDCFTEGLKEMLEDENILKVFHDCRLPSDMLYHQYGIRLVNIFDTQVAAAFVYRLRHHGDWDRYVEGLAPCLLEHLDLSQEQVHFMVVREHAKQNDEEVWSQRPPKRRLIEAALKNVMYLLELRQVLVEKMMEEYVAGVNIYLTHVKDASSSDAKKYQSMAHLLPVAFQDIRNFMVARGGRGKQRIETKDKNGFRENCRGIVQSNVNFSRDSLWHMGVPPKGRGLPRFAAALANQSDGKPELKSPDTEKTSTGDDGLVPTDSELPARAPEASSTVDDRVQDVHCDASEGEETKPGSLSSGSIMKALARDQEGPHSCSDTSDIGAKFIIKPAGVTVQPRRKQTRLPRVFESLQRKWNMTGSEADKPSNHGNPSPVVCPASPPPRVSPPETEFPKRSKFVDDDDDDGWETSEIVFKRDQRKDCPSDSPTDSVQVSSSNHIPQSPETENHLSGLHGDSTPVAGTSPSQLTARNTDTCGLHQLGSVSPGSGNRPERAARCLGTSLEDKLSDQSAMKNGKTWVSTRKPRPKYLTAQERNLCVSYVNESDGGSMDGYTTPRHSLEGRHTLEGGLYEYRSPTSNSSPGLSAHLVPQQRHSPMEILREAARRQEQ